MIAQGTIVGHRYRIIDLIGTGGMAHVYRAVNLSSRKIVAIKVLKDEYRNDAEFLRRFEREARAVLHLSHENIVRAFDVGETDGLPYIVLEFVDGKTLKEILDENGPMPARIAVALVVQVLDALGAAHAAGIIHRDVKPQNVIVMQSGKSSSWILASHARWTQTVLRLRAPPCAVRCIISRRSKRRDYPFPRAAICIPRASCSTKC